MYYTKIETPICEIILAGDEEGLKHLHLNTGEGKRIFKIYPEWQKNDSFFENTVTQIKEYLDGRRTTFDIRLAPDGTEYQKRVWTELRKIPFGKTQTYGQIAAELGNKNAARAVGMANSKNPIPIIVPCHRVIGSNGSLTGFAHGLRVKQLLLNIELKT
ncbi:MAG: methylated-DNA--[protein]-cysteine S-methyltransferase [Spirochaetales bacterium]|nr:methylated-DNA--[protein]-cysteine S-methyltransferase [Spirochaetales bacterium]